MAAYYNEHDKFAAAWLRELIKAELIADGEVDERDVQEVRAEDVRGFTQCHFFAGIGGWSYALRLAGWPDNRPVWTGSCPCQPFSAAGKAKGGADDRHLWPHWARLIRECAPPTIFGEQVESAIAHGWLDAVFDDLEREGYACGAACLSAASVGAFHIRQRLWFVADQQIGRRREECPITGRIGARNGEERWAAGFEPSGDVGELADTGHGAGRRGDPRTNRSTHGTGEENDGALGHGGETGELGHAESPDGRLPIQQRGSQQDCAESERAGEVGVMGHADPARSQGRILGRDGTDERVAGATGLGGGVGDAESDRREGQSLYPDRDAPERDPQATTLWDNAEWIFCRDGKHRPVEPGIFPLAHGVSGRVGLLRGAGNGIVPQVAQAFIESYLGLER